MKKVFLFIISGLPCLAMFNATVAQQVSEKSKQIETSFNNLKKHPNFKKYRLDYVNIFPGNKKEFINVFDPPDYHQLYDGHGYIDAFLRLDQYYPDKVISKAINIGKALTWDADAINYLQGGIVDLGNLHPRIFIEKLKSLKAKERTHLIAFLADVENHHAYPKYKQLIKTLSGAGEKGLADQFIDAMRKREKQPHN